VKIVEPNDPQYMSQINAYKSQYPSLKLIVSIGGWNFPSAYFSSMVSSSANRNAFITSLFSYVLQYSLDGVDFDWEFPCSPPRTDYVKFTCSDIQPSYDAGGKCPQDYINFYTFISELRAAANQRGLTTFWISIAGQAAVENYQFFQLKNISPLIDMWHIMTYDYTVSDTSTSNLTAPNSPLYTPKNVPFPASTWSINTTVQGYLAAGVPANKIMIGAALYGHTWYVPGASNWQSYGLTGQLQNECCGVFKATYGAEPGVGSQQCGLLMTSEIQNLLGGLSGYLDPVSQTMIGYQSSQGVWVSFDNAQSFTVKANYVKNNNLAGIFTFDSSMDTMSGGTWTYQMMQTINQALGGTSTSSTSTTTSTTSTTTGGFCTGKQQGMYCINKTQWENCPSQTIQTCAPGTQCVQDNNYILCQ